MPRVAAPQPRRTPIGVDARHRNDQLGAPHECFAIISPSLRLLAAPAFVAASLAMFLAILAQAMGGIYLSLFAVEQAGLAPLELTAFLTTSAVSGIVLTAIFGNWFDRTGSRLPLILSLSGTIVAYGIFAVTSDKAVLYAVALIPLGLGAASFPLIFAGAKEALETEDAALAAQGMAALRMMSSLAWAVGPAVAALLVALWGMPAAFAGGAVSGAVALALALPQRHHHPRSRKAVAEGMDFGLVGPGAIAMTLSTAAMFIGSTAMAIVTVRDLGGTATDVGLLFSICAAIEVPVMFYFVARPLHRAGRALLVAGFGIFAAYFVANLVIPGLATMYVSQILRAVAIGIVSVVGMQYIQELMPTRPGAAAALFSNTSNVAWLLSGLTTGTWAASFGYWSLFGLCAALLVAGGLAIALIARFPRR
jgi:SET family sugar efflux transporter-like MFS transporter